MLVRKFLVLAAVLLGFSVPGQSQYTNAWINYSQQYFKVPVAKDGIYRLTTADLQAAGFPVNTVDPRLVQLIHRGTEQAITVSGESDARFDTNDYIEFYGQRNDGTLDSMLYQPASSRPHPYYNLFSDTAAYFLTWNLGAVRGKRMINFFQNNVSGIPKETAQRHEERIVYAAQYSGGNTTGNGEIQNSFFDEGEGWTDVVLCTNQGCDSARNYTIDHLDKRVSAAGNPSLEIMIVGRDELNHYAKISVGPDASSLRPLTDVSFVNFQTRKLVLDLNWADISVAGKLFVRVSGLGVGGQRERISVSYIRVIIPQSFDLTGTLTKTIQLIPNGSGKSYVELPSAANSTRLWDITDVNNVSSIGTSTSSGVLSAVVNNTISTRAILASGEINTTSVHAINFRQIDAALYNYIIVTHKSLLDASSAYASYRSSAAGGAYTPLTVTVDQLYNQFSYGETSPLAIYQLMKYMVEKGSPSFLFLIGKGLDVSQGFNRKTTLLSTDMRDLVPSSGLPASDMLYSANLKGSGYVPTVATGRLSASTPAQVTAYLNKIKETEASPFNDLWHKEGLHLSGGILPEELIDFRSFMDGFKSIAEGKYWGAKITTIAKHDPTAVKQINVSDQVNSGVNLITFFGHSSPGTIDIDIGKASDPKLGYNNPGKYPVFLINGCNAGNFFANGTSFGEDWMLTSNKGARGFIAHSFYGYVQNLRSYTDMFYRIGFADSTFIKRGIGEVQRELASQYLAAYGTNITNVTQVQQMVLLGDPAIHLFGTTRPDYATNDASISLHSFTSKPVTVESDSFAIRVIVRNLGAFSDAPLNVRLIRTYSDNVTREYTKKFAPVSVLDTLEFTVKKERSAGFGSNQFQVTLDYTNTIPELNEANNMGAASFIIQLGGTMNLSPFPFAIVGNPNVDFIFQAVNPLGEQRDFQIELDTSSSFNSADLKHWIVSGKNLLSTKFLLTGSDSTVYYWRTRLDKPSADESSLWTTSSFTLIRNSPAGWMQRKYGQIGDNLLEGLIAGTPAEGLQFIKTSSDLLVTTYGWDNPASYLDVSVKINNAEYNLATEFDPCRNNTINFISFNKTTLVPYPALDLGFQSLNTCGREPQVINSFSFPEMDNGSDHDVLAMIDHIHSGDSVLVFSVGNVNHAAWSAAMRAKLALLGIDDNSLSSLDTGEPLIIFARKDAPVGTAKVFLSPSQKADTAKLQVRRTITGRYTSGRMSTPVIGPAAHWRQLAASAKHIQSSDEYKFSLIGVDAAGQETLLQTSVPSLLDLTAIDPATYPSLKLQLETSDVTNLDPVQLSKWYVLFDPVPEGVLLFDGPPQQQQLTEGEAWTGKYRFVNISPQSFTDSVSVEFSVLTSGVKKETSFFKILAPSPHDTTHFSVNAVTAGKVGLNDVDVFVNRDQQPEQFHQNNEISLTAYLNVITDKIGPLLDVTIDGRYLINNDYVSANPVIKIVIRDEHTFLLKTDTTGVNIVLTPPCDNGSCDGQQIYLSRADVTWTPATPSGFFTVVFKPKNLSPGTYQLFVEGQDGSGNKSGEQSYEIQFQVTDDDSFHADPPYPNPSASIFIFGFNVTGDQTPDSFTLDIFSFDGRLLQHFTKTDIADFHVGRNELIWDPKDGPGALGAGLYIYRTQFNIGQRIIRESGKLILTR